MFGRHAAFFGVVLALVTHAGTAIAQCGELMVVGYTRMLGECTCSFTDLVRADCDDGEIGWSAPNYGLCHMSASGAGGPLCAAACAENETACGDADIDYGCSGT